MSRQQTILFCHCNYMDEKKRIIFEIAAILLVSQTSPLTRLCIERIATQLGEQMLFVWFFVRRAIVKCHMNKRKQKPHQQPAPATWKMDVVHCAHIRWWKIEA